MKTREQKAAQIEKAKQLIGKNTSLLFVDFSGVSASTMNALKAKLRGIGATLNVVKKRLMTIALKAQGIPFDAHETFDGQAAAIVSSGDIADIAGLVQRFAKDQIPLKLLGGFNITERAYIDTATVVALSKLPPRQILLGQLIGSIASPIAGLIAVLDGRRAQIETK